MAEKVENDHITAMNRDSEQGTQTEFGKEAARVQSLGSVRLRSESTGEVLLVPTPTKDPNDPLV